MSWSRSGLVGFFFYGHGVLVALVFLGDKHPHEHQYPFLTSVLAGPWPSLRRKRTGRREIEMSIYTSTSLLSSSIIFHPHLSFCFLCLSHGYHFLLHFHLPRHLYHLRLMSAWRFCLLCIFHMLPSALSFHVDPLLALVSAVWSVGLGLEYRDWVGGWSVWIYLCGPA